MFFKCHGIVSGSVYFLVSAIENDLESRSRMVTEAEQNLVSIMQLQITTSQLVDSLQRNSLTFVSFRAGSVNFAEQKRRISKNANSVFFS